MKILTFSFLGIIFSVFCAYEYSFTEKAAGTVCTIIHVEKTNDSIYIITKKHLAHDEVQTITDNINFNEGRRNIILFFSEPATYFPKSASYEVQLTQLLRQQPEAVLFNDGSLVWHPDYGYSKDMLPKQSAWANATTIYSAKPQK